MVSRVSIVCVLGCALFAAAYGASIMDNRINYETPRINNGDELIMAIANDCFDSGVMSCIKGKVLTYLDTNMGLKEEQARSFEEKNIDKVIYERMARILSTNEIKIQLPQTIFQGTVLSYRPDTGLDINMPQEEARGDMLKKKLLLPVLLLLKLKMKALMPIFVAIIGLKATKALILSKLAITLVLGFILVQLLKKKGMEMPMSMMPMMPPPSDPSMAYGAPAPSPAPASSYEPSWEPNTGGPYSRVWEPSSGSSSTGSNLAYSSYYPSSSSSSGVVSSGSSSSSSSSHTTY